MGKTTLIATGFFSIYLFLVIFIQWQTFAISYSKQEYEYRYSESQYVKGNASVMQMGDGDIYTYAGIRYAQGEDPTKINFEHTPFVKYLFGISFLLTGKPNWVIVPLAYISFFSFWYLAHSLLSSRWAVWLSVIFFFGHTTIIKAIPQTMLDFPMTALLLAMTASMVALTKKVTIGLTILFGVLSGLLLAAKYPIPLIAIYLVLIYLWLFLKKISLKHICIAAFITIITYITSYLSYFIHGHSLIDFLKFEWWRWQWFQGKTDSVKFMLLSTIFLGKYPKWWETTGEYYIVPHWNIFWPISLLLYLVSLFKIPKTINNPLFSYQLWVIISLAVYMLGAAEDRFIVPLIPGFALFGVYVIEQSISKIKVSGIIHT